MATIFFMERGGLEGTPWHGKPGSDGPAQKSQAGPNRVCTSDRARAWYDTRIQPDPLGFCPIFHSETTIDILSQSRAERNLEMRDESSKQRISERHALNPILIIFDKHKNPHNF
jgi:hypothetical protein